MAWMGARVLLGSSRRLTRWRSFGVLDWRLEWKADDLWFGVYRDLDTFPFPHAWICLIPCLPIHVRIRVVSGIVLMSED